MRSFAEFKPRARPVLAGLMATLFFAVTLLSASEKLHGTLHVGADAEANHLPCAVCAVAQGQVDAPPGGVSEVFAALSVAWTQTRPDCSIVKSLDLATAPGRGPPASISSQA